MKHYLFGGISLALAITACDSSKQSARPAPQPVQQPSSDAQQNQENTQNTSNSQATAADVGFYTGFDGKTDFSLLLPSFRSYKIVDPTVARIETTKVKLSDEILNSLIEEMKKTNPDIDATKVKSRLGRERSVYKIVPLKAGVTEIESSRPSNRPESASAPKPSSGGGGGGSVWGEKSSKMKLVVTAYSLDAMTAGEKRYTTDGGGGNLRSCKSCHETGQEGAPPHELGRIMEISDAQALQWVKTGQTGDRKAKIPHAWEFSNANEEKGIVPFLRSRQTHDVENLMKLEIEEAIANGATFSGGGRPPSP